MGDLISFLNRERSGAFLALMASEGAAGSSPKGSAVFGFC